MKLSSRAQLTVGDHFNGCSTEEEAKDSAALVCFHLRVHGQLEDAERVEVRHTFGGRWAVGIVRRYDLFEPLVWREDDGRLTEPEPLSDDRRRPDPEMERNIAINLDASEALPDGRNNHE